MMDSLDPKRRQEYDELMIRLQNTEECVVEVLEQRALSEGWGVIEKHVGSDVGCDLKLQKAKRVVFIEVKGERESQKNAKGRVMMAMGQIIMVMGENNPDNIYSFCVAFPDTDNFRKIVDKIPVDPWQKLGFKLILVDCPKKLVKVRQADSSMGTNLGNLDDLF